MGVEGCPTSGFFLTRSVATARYSARNSVRDSPPLRSESALRKWGSWGPAAGRGGGEGLGSRTTDEGRRGKYQQRVWHCGKGSGGGDRVVACRGRSSEAAGGGTGKSGDAEPTPSRLGDPGAAAGGSTALSCTACRQGNNCSPCNESCVCYA